MKNRITENADLTGKARQAIQNEELEPTLNSLGHSFAQTLKEIGGRHNLSTERIRRIEKQALLLLKPYPADTKPTLA